MGCADTPAVLFVEDGAGPQPEMSNPEASVANTSLRRIFSFRQLRLPPNWGERQGSRAVSTGRRNTLIFLERWSVDDEVSDADVLHG